MRSYISQTEYLSVTQAIPSPAMSVPKLSILYKGQHTLHHKILLPWPGLPGPKWVSELKAANLDIGQRSEK